MKLPTTIYLGHRKIKVKEIGARTANKDEIYGDFDVSKDLIRIDSLRLQNCALKAKKNCRWGVRVGRLVEDDGEGLLWPELL